MNDEIIALFSLISLLLLVILWFWLHQDYRTDAVRQKLFGLRDELFDAASMGKISFNHPTYGMLRTTINGFVRFAHRLNLWHLFLLVCIMDERKDQGLKPFSERLLKSMETLEDEQKETIQMIYFQMNLIIIQHLIHASPVFRIVLFVPAKITFKAKKMMDKKMKEIVDRFRGPLDKIDSAALATGEI